MEVNEESLHQRYSAMETEELVELQHTSDLVDIPKTPANFNYRITMYYDLIDRFLFKFIAVSDSFTHLVLPLMVKLHFLP